MNRIAGGSVDKMDRWFLVLGLVVTTGLLLVVMFFLDAANLDVWTGAITFLALSMVTLPILRWIAARDGDAMMFRIYAGGLIIKLLSSLVRYFFIFVVYNSQGDAGVYHEAAAEFVRRLHAGIPIHPLPVISNFPLEVQRIGDLTGAVYVLTGTSAYAGFFVFTWLCFIGQILFLRGFRAAVPEGDHRRYAVLVLFLPSLLFWPSSIGKEAVMIFCLGIVTYGGALLLAPRPRPAGAAYFALGLSLLLLLRPHIAAMSLGALILAVAVGALARSEHVTIVGRMLRLAVLVGLLATTGIVSTSLSESLSEKTDSDSVAFSTSEDAEGFAESQLDRTLKQTSVGNSEFSPAAASNPFDLPWAAVSVLFRPFPWEARGLNSLMAAGEGALLVALFMVSWRRWIGLYRIILRRPYLTFVVAYLIAFVVGFSYVGNFGILTRQRTQVFPGALVLLSLPNVVGRGRGTHVPHFSAGLSAPAGGGSSVAGGVGVGPNGHGQ